MGLGAAAIPALLHLLERRTPPEAEFPPLRYLRDAERQSARRLRLRHLLLLILRTALVAVIVLAAARPIMPTGGSGGNGTGSGAVHAWTARRPRRSAWSSCLRWSARPTSSPPSPCAALRCMC